MSEIFPVDDTGAYYQSDDSEANPGFAIGMGSASGSVDTYWHFRGSSFYSGNDAASISIGATDMETQGYIYGNHAYYSYFSAHGDFSSHGSGVDGLLGMKNGDFSGSRYRLGQYVREGCGARWANASGGRGSVLRFGRACFRKMGTFDLNPTTGSQSVTGLGFQPDFVLFLGCVGVSPGYASWNEEGANYMVGAADGEGNQWVGSYRSYFYAGSGLQYKRQSEWYNNACIAHIGMGGYTTPTSQAQHASLTSMDADGFTINLTQAGYNSNGWPMRVKYLAVKVYGDGQILVGSGVQGDAAVSCGFDPEIIMFAGTQGVDGATSNEAYFNHGAVDSGGTNVNYFAGAMGSPPGDGSVQRSMGRNSSDHVIWMTDYTHSGTPPGFDTWVGGDPIAAASASMNGDGADLTWTYDNGDDREFGWAAFRVDGLSCPLSWLVSMYSRLSEPAAASEWTLRSSSWDGSFNDIISTWSETLGKFIAVADMSVAPFSITSTDGITWDDESLGGGFEPRGILSGNIFLKDDEPLMLIGGADGVTVGKSSTDAATWTNISTLPSGHGGGQYAYSPSLDTWIAPKSSGTASQQKLVYSIDDRVTWIPVNTPWFGISASIWGCCWSEPLDLFVVVGAGGNPAPRPVLMTSPDGINWTDRSATVPSNWLNGWPYGVMWSDAFDCFIAYGGDSGLNKAIMTSTDGINWIDYSSDPLQECFSVIEVGSDIWAAGYNDDDTVSVFRTSDFITWEDMECPLFEWVTTLAYSPSLQMVVAMGAATGVTEAIATFGPV